MTVQVLEWERGAATDLAAQIAQHEAAGWRHMAGATQNAWQVVPAALLQGSAQLTQRALRILAAAWVPGDVVLIPAPTTPQETHAAVAIAATARERELPVAVRVPLGFLGQLPAALVDSARALVVADVKQGSALLERQTGHQPALITTGPGYWNRVNFQERWQLQGSTRVDYLGNAALREVGMQNHAADQLGAVPQRLHCDFGLVTGDDSAALIAIHLAAKQPLLYTGDAPLVEFLRRNNLGIELPNTDAIAETLQAVTTPDYHQFILNVERLAMPVRSGYYLRRALLALDLQLNLH
jgi:hypothetical protein